MNPDNDQSFGADYLSQITTKPPKKNLKGIDKRFLIVGGLFLVIIIVVIIAVSAGGSRGLPNAEVLGSRLVGLNSLIDFGKEKDITDPTVQHFVAEVSIVRASDRVQLGKIYGQNQAYGKPSTAALAQESVAKTLEELEAAKTTGQVNELFKEALIEKIKSVVSLLRSSLASAETQTSRQILQTTIDNYEILLERFAN